MNCSIQETNKNPYTMVTAETVSPHPRPLLHDRLKNYHLHTSMVYHQWRHYNRYVVASAFMSWRFCSGCGSIFRQRRNFLRDGLQLEPSPELDVATMPIPLTVLLGTRWWVGRGSGDAWLPSSVRRTDGRHKYSEGFLFWRLVLRKWVKSQKWLWKVCTTSIVSPQFVGSDSESDVGIKYNTCNQGVKSILKYLKISTL